MTMALTLGNVLGMLGAAFTLASFLMNRALVEGRATDDRSTGSRMR